jgi:hypothetical protein
MVASDGKNVEELKKSKIVKGNFSLIKKAEGQCFLFCQ